MYRFESDIERRDRSEVNAALVGLMQIGSWILDPNEPSDSEKVELAIYFSPKEFVETGPLVMGRLERFGIDGEVEHITGSWFDMGKAKEFLWAGNAQALAARAARYHHRVSNVTFDVYGNGHYHVDEIKPTNPPINKPPFWYLGQCITAKTGGLERANGQWGELMVRKRALTEMTISFPFFVGRGGLPDVREIVVGPGRAITIIRHFLGDRDFVWNPQASQRGQRIDRWITLAAVRPVPGVPDEVEIEFPGRRRPRKVAVTKMALMMALLLASRNLEFPEKQVVTIRRACPLVPSSVGWVIVDKQGRYLSRLRSVLDMDWTSERSHAQIFPALEEAIACAEGRLHEIYVDASVEELGQAGVGPDRRRMIHLTSWHLHYEGAF